MFKNSLLSLSERQLTIKTLFSFFCSAYNSIVGALFLLCSFTRTIRLSRREVSTNTKYTYLNSRLKDAFSYISYVVLEHP